MIFVQPFACKWKKCPILWFQIGNLEYLEMRKKFADITAIITRSCNLVRYTNNFLVLVWHYDYLAICCSVVQRTSKKGFLLFTHTYSCLVELGLFCDATDTNLLDKLIYGASNIRIGEGSSSQSHCVVCMPFWKAREIHHHFSQ